jgi:hypothetical protein
MFRRLLSLTVIALLLAEPARAQLVVIDPGNLAQAIVIASRTLQEYTTLIQQYQTILRMAQGLGPLVQYRMPPIGITAHDPSRWLYGAPWLQGLNTGDAQGALYKQTARPLERPDGVLDPLPSSAQQAIEDAYATIEITDSIAEIAGNQVALVRGYSGTLQQATQTYENDVLNTLPGYHDMTAVLDKVAVGELLARRQDMATNQLLSHALEQLLARSKRMRDTDAATMNMRLLGLRDGRTAGANLIRGTADALRTWRQP